MSNVPKHTGQQPSEFVDEPENQPGDQEPPSPPDEVPPDEQSDG
ncbi:MAG: hypothetical protein V7636_2434 [Actinomycetota bacterium]|jgi:hypothetical protein